MTESKIRINNRGTYLTFTFGTLDYNSMVRQTRDAYPEATIIWAVGSVKDNTPTPSINTKV